MGDTPSGCEVLDPLGQKSGSAPPFRNSLSRMCKTGVQQMGGRGEETSPRTEGSNTPTKVDGLTLIYFFLGLTWGHFHPRPSFGKGSGTCILRTKYPGRTCHGDSGWLSLPGAQKGISALFGCSCISCRNAGGFHVGKNVPNPFIIPNGSL